MLNAPIPRICVISIHAPREGGDLRTKVRYRLYEGFQSTPPARGATVGREGL